jgi:hypothetical protein
LPSVRNFRSGFRVAVVLAWGLLCPRASTID